MSRQIDLLRALTADITRDNTATLAMLALCRNGHPRAHSCDHAHASRPIDPQPDETTPYADPTGEAAIRPDHAVTDGRRYAQLIAEAIEALSEADDIRRHYAALRIAKGLPEPDQWCTNCIRIGRFAPRETRRTLCAWCRKFKQATGHEPPTPILEKHHSGQRIYQKDFDQGKR